MTSRLLSLAIACASAAYVVILSLPWARIESDGESAISLGRVVGWTATPATVAGPLAILLALLELLRAAGVDTGHKWRALISFLLAAGVAITTAAGLANIRFNAVLGFGSADYLYGAWLGLAAAVAIAFGGAVRLAEHIRARDGVRV